MAAKKNKGKDKKNTEKGKNRKAKPEKLPKAKDKPGVETELVFAKEDEPDKSRIKVSGLEPLQPIGESGTGPVTVVGEPPSMDPIARRSLLFDYYGPLLSEKQREMYILYYEDDLTLSEIAANIGITRQGVHDALKKSDAALKGYEEKLHLLDKHREYEAALNYIRQSANKFLEQETDAGERQRWFRKIIEMISGLDV